MVVYETVKEENNLIVQVEANMKTGKVEIPKVNLSKTTRISNFRGIKNLECTSIICSDTQKGKTIHTTGLAYTTSLGKLGQLQIGGRVSHNSITVPLMLKDSHGNAVGMEVSLTADIRQITKNGVNVVTIINIPEVDGQLVIKYNIITQAFVVQYRSKFPDGKKGDDDNDDDFRGCCAIEVTMDLQNGLMNPEISNYVYEHQNLTVLENIGDALRNTGETIRVGIDNTIEAIGDGINALIRNVAGNSNNVQTRHVAYN